MLKFERIKEMAEMFSLHRKKNPENIEELFRDCTYEQLFTHFDEEWLTAKVDKVGKNTIHERIQVWKKYADEFDKFMLLMGDPTAGKPMGLIEGTK